MDTLQMIDDICQLIILIYCEEQNIRVDHGVMVLVLYGCNWVLCSLQSSGGVLLESVAGLLEVVLSRRSRPLLLRRLDESIFTASPPKPSIESTHSVNPMSFMYDVCQLS